MSHKYTRPENPFTPRVTADIEAKANIAMKHFKVLGNAEATEYRRNDMRSLLAGEVMKAHRKFRDNNSCSFETFASRFLSLGVKHCYRELNKMKKRDQATVSCDCHIKSDEEDSHSFVDSFADPSNRFEDDMTLLDIKDIIVILECREPLLAKILTMYFQGYKLSEMCETLNIKKSWLLYDVLWPRTLATVQKIFGRDR